MKAVVIGGSGLIGSKLVQNLRALGHEVVAASPSSGVNALTGEGLAEALSGAQVVIDVTNSPSFEPAAVLHFFETSTTNLLNAEAAAGVKHHVALSIVGVDGLPESGYFRAKVAQERLIKDSGVPYSIVRATQFFEFIKGIGDSATRGDEVHLPHVLLQPIAANDVSAALATVAAGAPLNGTLDIAGPEAFYMDEIIAQALDRSNDPRRVVTDNAAGYFGAPVSERSLVPALGGDARLAATHYADWLSQG